jgi:D-serine deaminase-like pyridoxal phosphate-dependent protein
MTNLLEKIISLHSQINTPALVLDLERMQLNIRSMQQLADAHKKQLLPHIKTHKSVLIARQQLSMGAKNYTAKVGEAEVMAEGQVDNILSPIRLPIRKF